MAPPAPHRPPSDPAAVARIALAAASLRAFGARGAAWEAAREERRARRRRARNDAGRAGARTEGEPTEEEEEEEEEEDVAAICEAIATALAEDAGGCGTAGFHPTKVDDVHLLTHPSGDDAHPPPAAVYAATLIPCDPDTKEALDPSALLERDDGTGDVTYSGNDEFYLRGGDNAQSASQFRMRITVSRAREGVAAQRYYEALFAKRNELAGESEADVDRWANEDEELASLRQALLDAREKQVGGFEEGAEGALGYSVEVMLIGPHVTDDETVIAPPAALDRLRPGAGQATSASATSMAEWEAEGGGGSAFQRDLFASPHFQGTPGPWEAANLRAFGDVVLDVRKALARVEFPEFPEGCKDRTFREVYQLNARLKSGSFATVCRGTHRATGRKIAVKCVLRKDLPPGDDAAIFDEVLILSTLRHGHICPLIDFFEERECYFLVMELMGGGDLFDRIGARKSYSEFDARDLCRKMLESLRYCHENAVAHCDMKPKNLLLVSEDDDVQMKLADFGFATRVYEPQSLTKQCGTPFFVAPEVLMRTPYDQQSDMWSCGVIVFLLLGGDLPFMGRSQKELFRNIVLGRYEFEEEGWAHVSDEAKDLVRQLLVTDPSKRLTSQEALMSPWMRQRGNMLARNDLHFTSQRLKGFNARLKLKASMIAVGSVVSLTRMSARSSFKGGPSDRALSAKHPSFLDLPDEGEAGAGEDGKD